MAHEYFTHAVDIFATRSLTNRDWFGGASDLYVEVTAGNSPVGTDRVLDSREWQVEDARRGVWYPFVSSRPRQGGQSISRAFVGPHHFCRPPGTPVRIGVYDRDAGDDDLLGAITLQDESVNHSGGLVLGDAELSFAYQVQGSLLEPGPPTRRRRVAVSAATRRLSEEDHK